MRFGCTADALSCTNSLRDSRMMCWSSDVLGFRGIPGLSESLILIEHQIVLCHCSDVVLLVEVLLLIVEVEQFLVQRLIEQLEILQTSLDGAVFPERDVGFKNLGHNLFGSEGRFPCSRRELQTANWQKCQWLKERNDVNRSTRQMLQPLSS